LGRENDQAKQTKRAIMGEVIQIFRRCELSTTWNERVGQRRRALNLTKTELARRCGVSVPTAQQWETGEITETSASNFDRLAKELEVSVEWLRFGTQRSSTDVLNGLTQAQKDQVLAQIDELRAENATAIEIAEELKRASNGG
jgi:transcriptional regulator with XRE-family HTH domain